MTAASRNAPTNADIRVETGAAFQVGVCLKTTLRGAITLSIPVLAASMSSVCRRTENGFVALTV